MKSLWILEGSTMYSISRRERISLLGICSLLSFCTWACLLACFELLEKRPGYNELVTASSRMITPRSPRVTLLVFKFQPGLFSSRLLRPQMLLAELFSMTQYDRSKKPISFLDLLTDSRSRRAIMLLEDRCWNLWTGWAVVSFDRWWWSAFDVSLV